MKYYQKRKFGLYDINRGKITLNYFQKEALDKRFPYNIVHEGKILRHEQTLALDEALYRDDDTNTTFHFCYDEEKKSLYLLCIL